MARQQKRSHSKIAKLPDELRQAVDRLILDGKTYQEITDYLSDMGRAVSRSSVNRYGQKFVARMEKLRIFQDQAKIIVERTKDRPALETAEAANQMAIQTILEAVLEMDDLKGAKATELFKSLALLERSAVQREKLKLDVTKSLELAVKQIKDELQAELIKQPDILGRIVTIVDSTVNEIKEKQK